MLGGVSGTLYIQGKHDYHAAESELRFKDLHYALDTESLLLKSAEWLAHSKLLERLQGSAVLKLAPELEKAKQKANEELEKLEVQLPKEIRWKASVEAPRIEQLHFAKENVFGVVKVPGKMSVTWNK